MSSGTKSLHKCLRRCPPPRRERSVVGQRMGCKQRSFAADWHQRLPVVRGLNLQQPPGLSQINEVDCCTETAGKSTGCVKKLDGIKWPVAEDSQIDVAVGSAFTSRPASVEPCP